MNVAVPREDSPVFVPHSLASIWPLASGRWNNIVGRQRCLCLFGKPRNADIYYFGVTDFDARMEHLAALTTLTALNLDSTGFTESGIMKIGRLKSLRVLRTHIHPRESAADAVPERLFDSLRKQIPGLQVN